MTKLIIFSAVSYLAQVSLIFTEIDATLFPTSRKLIFGIDFWSRDHIRMGWFIHLVAKFGANICMQSDDTDTVRRSIWRPTTCWILIISEFAALHYYSRLVLELPTEFRSAISYTIVPDVRLITLREFASGFDFWTRGHLRMATIHLLAKHGANNK